MAVRSPPLSQPPLKVIYCAGPKIRRSRTLTVAITQPPLLVAVKIPPLKVEESANPERIKIKKIGILVVVTLPPLQRGKK